MVSILLLSTLILCSYSSTAQKVSLVFTAVLFRHGDRTPVDPYPTDPWRDPKWWPVKFGELTNKGKQQHYALGQWLRNRYKGLISHQFDPDELYVRSTDVDRTLMSAQSNLAGMYPPVGNDIWDNNLMWQPIPIHSMLKENDEVLAMGKKCKNYNAEMKKFKKSKIYMDMIHPYADLMKYLTEKTGKVIKHLSEIEYIYSTLAIEELYNFTLPNWTHSVYPDAMREPACLSFRIPTFNYHLAKFKVGPLLKDVTSKMNAAIEAKRKNESHLKMIVYSAHDDQVGDILNSLGVFDGNCPVYTATVLFELWTDASLEHNYIRVLYRNTTGTDKQPYVLTLPDCHEMCPFEQFQSQYEKIIPVNWEDECNQPVMFYETIQQ